MAGLSSSCSSPFLIFSSLFFKKKKNWHISTINHFSDYFVKTYLKHALSGKNQEKRIMIITTPTPKLTFSPTQRLPLRLPSQKKNFSTRFLVPCLLLISSLLLFPPKNDDGAKMRGIPPARFRPVVMYCVYCTYLQQYIKKEKKKAL